MAARLTTALHKKGGWAQAKVWPAPVAAMMKRRTNRKWVARITLVSMIISATFTLASAKILQDTGYVIAFSVLFLFIALGILFDIVGVAVTSASEVPFHSMASHNARGAKEALILLRHSEKVASICNDVVGDIAGIVSGTTAAIIVVRLAATLGTDGIFLQIAVPGLVAGLTIGGKAVGKAVAINHNTAIVHFVGTVMRLFRADRKKR